jgi:Nucleoside transporter
MAMIRFLKIQGMSAAGVAVSLVNFLVAVGKDPADYYNAYCRSTAPTAAVVSRNFRQRMWKQHEDAGEWFHNTSCQPYTKVDGAIFLYFVLGILVLSLCLIGFSYIHNLHISEEDDTNDRILRRRRDATYETIRTSDIHTGGLSRNNAPFSDASDGHGVPRSSEPLQISPSTINDADGVWLMATHHDAAEADAHTLPNHGNETSDASFAAVWECVKGPAVCIFLTFFVSLGLFPGWTSEIQSIHQCHTNRFANDLFVPSSFLLFNLGDFMGRWWAAGDAARHYLAHPPDQLSAKLVRLSVLRFGLFPLLFLCHTGSATSPMGGWVIHSDVYALVVQGLLATSNGILISAAFLHASSTLSNVVRQGERMSEILSLAVSLGLLGGSLLSVGVARGMA